MFNSVTSFVSVSVQLRLVLFLVLDYNFIDIHTFMYLTRRSKRSNVDKINITQLISVGFIS